MILIDELAVNGGGRRHLVQTARWVGEHRVRTVLSAEEVLVYSITTLDVLMKSDDVVVANDYVCVADATPGLVELGIFQTQVSKLIGITTVRAIRGKYAVGEPNGTAVVYVDPAARVGVAVACVGLDVMRNQYFANLMAAEIQGTVAAYVKQTKAAEEAEMTNVPA
jgi:hypothetical protein